MMQPRRLLELTLPFCVFAIFAFAKRAPQHAPPVYDPATVVTVSGTIQDIEQHQCSLGWNSSSGHLVRPATWLGIHVILQTDYGILDAHLGPSSFLKEHHLTLAKDDQIEVTGSKFAGDLPVIIIVKEIKKGKRLLELRDGTGQPLWSLR
ncbi:MAG: hypothetical protein WBL63_25195 [Candidatus Acidiferrum sp.]